MAEVMLVAISPIDVGERPVINTGISMVGLKGDNVFCGHCGRQIMSNFDLNRMEVDMVYQCGTCNGHNIKPR